MSTHPRTHILLVVSLIAAGFFTSVLSIIDGSGPEAWAQYAPYTILPGLISAAAVWLLRRRALWEQLTGAIIAIYAVVWLHSARTNPQWTGGLTLDGLSNWFYPAVFGLPILLIAAALWAVAVLVTRFAGRSRTDEAPASAPEAVDGADQRVTLRLLAAGIGIGAAAFFAFCLLLNSVSAEHSPGLLLALAWAAVLPGILSALATAGLLRMHSRLGAGAAVLLAVVLFTAVSLVANRIADVGTFLLPASLSALACGLIAWWVLSAIVSASTPHRILATSGDPAAEAELRAAAVSARQIG